MDYYLVDIDLIVQEGFPSSASKFGVFDEGAEQVTPVEGTLSLPFHCITYDI
jgi:hypothetical protein